MRLFYDSGVTGSWGGPSYLGEHGFKGRLGEWKMRLWAGDASATIIGDYRGLSMTLTAPKHKSHNLNGELGYHLLAQSVEGAKTIDGTSSNFGYGSTTVHCRLKTKRD